MGGDFKERRSSKRVSYICEVECEGAGGRLNTRITDISVDGAFIDSMICFPPGSTVKLKFKLRSVDVNVTAEVRYCLPQIGMGVRFLDLAPEARSVIEKIVQEAE